MQAGSGERRHRVMQGVSGKKMQADFWEMSLKKLFVSIVMKQKLRQIEMRKKFRLWIVMKQKQRQIEMQKRMSSTEGMVDAQRQIEMQKRMSSTEGMVDALSRHREILRRDISFLRTEVALRDLGTIAGKRAYLEETRSNSEPPQLIQQMSELSVEKLGSSEIMVSFPYLVGKQEDALDFLLHESLELSNRIQSLASITREFNIPIPSEQVKVLVTVSRKLTFISRRIMNSDLFKPQQKNAISRKDKAIARKKKRSISYDMHNAGWKSIWGSGTPNCGFFDDLTTLSPVQFTCYPPGVFPYYGTISPALEIYSIRIVELNANLDWPLRVYGVVAARDEVDQNRNILFSRSRRNYQVLTKNDPFLRLTGPSRVIVATEPVTFEVDLKVMYGEESLDTAVLSYTYSHSSHCDVTPEIGRGCCTVQLSLKQLGRAVQATIVGVHLVEGGWPFEGGCRVSCFSSAAAKFIWNPTLEEVVLLDCPGGEMPVGPDNYICLSRNVVSVELQGTLRFSIQGFSVSGFVAGWGYVDIPAKHCQTSEVEFFVGNCKVKVVVAWSLLVLDKENLMLEGYISP